MKSDDTELYGLIHHLRNCPPEFQLHGHEPGRMEGTTALLYDLFRRVYGDVTVRHEVLPSLLQLDWRYFKENESRSIHIGIWFFSYSFFYNKPELLEGIKNFLLTRLPILCTYVKHEQWMEDEDRAEEFIREALQCCDLLLDHETKEEAQDRLDALSTVKRQEVLRETNESMERMKAIRKKMAEQKSREAANAYSRE